MNKILYIIALSLFYGLLPLNLFSQNIPTGTYTGTQFIEKQSNSKIALDGNITITTTIEVTSELTIDLNGYALKGDLENGGYVIDVKAGGELIIKDSKDIGHRGRIDSKGLYIWPAAETDTYLKPVYGGFITHAFKGDDINTQGIHVEGTCIMQGGRIMGCYTNSNGAAVNVSSSGSFSMTGGEISYNYAVGNGGGIYGYNISIASNNVDNVIIKNNRANCGGGIYILNNSKECKICYCTIESNYAATFGGGIYSSTPTTIEKSKIIKNRAMTSELSGQDEKSNKGRGGGFCFTGDYNFTIKNTEVSENACMYYGGGGHIQSKAYLKMEGNSRIYKNKALLGGAGGLHVTSEAIFELTSGSILENEADGHGGGIHSSYECNLILTGGDITNNTVTGRGGGIHINTGGSLELNGTNIISNKALKTPHYDYCEVKFNQADATYSWGERSSNSTEDDIETGYGGGVTIDAGTCKMFTGTISSNNAVSGGGGVALVMINTSSSNSSQLKVGEFTLVDGIISNNSTEGDGAGIYLMKNTMSNVTSVPESIQKGIPQILIQKGSVIQNTANGNGGGIYQDEKTKFRIEEGTDVILDGNESLNGSGGAVYIAQGEAEVEGGTISNNRAKLNGGALYINGKISMTSGTIENNYAANGGGLCVEAGDNLVFTNCRIIKNTASGYGGGIYVINKNANATADLEGGSIFSNNTASVAGGGLAVSGSITFDFNGSIQNNEAPNGGGIYLENTATLNYIGGFIRNNIANGDTNSNINTGYHLTVDRASGFGGGVYLNSGTELNFPESSSTTTFGFYGNAATVGGDDIFANGNGTTVNLPDVSTMTLQDWDVPVSDAGLYWVEDYVSNDTNYADGTNMITTNSYVPGRYQSALRMADTIGVLDINQYLSYQNKYLCLALGYDLYYLELQKKGLKAGEAAIIRVSYDRSNVRTIYREIILVGKGENEVISTMIILPPNKWYFNENVNWSWKYLPDNSEIVREINGQTDVKDPIVFTNNYRDDLEDSEKFHIEELKENRMMCK